MVQPLIGAGMSPIAMQQSYPAATMPGMNAQNLLGTQGAAGASGTTNTGDLGAVINALSGVPSTFSDGSTNLLGRPVSQFGQLNLPTSPQYAGIGDPNSRNLLEISDAMSSYYLNNPVGDQSTQAQMPAMAAQFAAQYNPSIPGNGITPSTTIPGTNTPSSSGTYGLGSSGTDSASLNQLVSYLQQTNPQALNGFISSQQSALGINNATPGASGALPTGMGLNAMS